MSEPLDINALMQQAQQMLGGQADAADVVVEGQAGGGAVKITVDGDFNFQKVSIAKSAVDPDDVELLEDLVLAALHDATRQVGEQGGGGFDLGGLDIGALLGGGAEGGMPDVSGLLAQFGLGGEVDDDDDDDDAWDDDDDASGGI